MSKDEIERRIEELKRKQDRHIAETGRTLVGVFPLRGSKDPTNETFVYTMGNSLKGLPELLIVGLHDDRGILNALSEAMIERGRAFDDREVYTFEGSNCPLCFVDAAEVVKDRYTVQANQRFGRDRYRVQQVVLSDKAGLFPWQQGCAKPYCDVVVHRAKGLLQ